MEGQNVRQSVRRQGPRS